MTGVAGAVIWIDGLRAHRSRNVGVRLIQAHVTTTAPCESIAVPLHCPATLTGVDEPADASPGAEACSDCPLPGPHEINNTVDTARIDSEGFITTPCLPTLAHDSQKL